MALGVFPPHALRGWRSKQGPWIELPSSQWLNMTDDVPNKCPTRVF